MRKRQLITLMLKYTFWGWFFTIKNNRYNISKFIGSGESKGMALSRSLSHSLNVTQEQMNLILPHQLICEGFKYSSKNLEKFISGHAISSF